MMTVETAITNGIDREELIKKAQEELKKMRENCKTWGVSIEIKNIREYISRADLTLTDIGSSEEELQICFKTGHMNAARTWLAIAREHCNSQDVGAEVGYIRSLAGEAKFNLDEIGTSDEELERLLSFYKPVKKWWQRLFSKNETKENKTCCSLHPNLNG